MMFAGVVDGVFGDFHHQIFIGHLGLAAQARIGFEAPSLVEQIFFELAGFFEAVETLAHNHVAGGAGAGFFAGVFDFDVVVEQQIANALAGGGVFNHFAFGAERGVGENGYFWHVVSFIVSAVNGLNQCGLIGLSLQIFHALAGEGALDVAVHAFGGKIIGGLRQRGGGGADLLGGVAAQVGLQLAD